MAELRDDEDQDRRQQSNNNRDILRQRLLDRIQEKEWRQQRPRDLAMLGQVAEIGTEAAAKIGGTKPGTTIPRISQHLKQRAGLLPTKGKPTFVDYWDEQDKVMKKGRRNPGTFEVIKSPGDPVITDPLETKFKREKTLSDRYNATRSQTDNTVKMERAYKQIMGLVDRAARAKTGATDIALTFSFMRLLDPGSVVREAEFALGESAAPLFSRLQILVDKVTKARRLHPEVVKEFGDVAGELWSQTLELQEQTDQSYREAAEEYGVDPDRFIRKWTPLRAARPTTGPEAQRTKFRDPKTLTPEEQERYIDSLSEKDLDEYMRLYKLGE